MASSQLSLYLSTNNIINPWQLAYKAAHSTESALLKVKNDIHYNLAKGECQALVRSHMKWGGTFKCLLILKPPPAVLTLPASPAVFVTLLASQPHDGIHSYFTQTCV